MTLKANKSNHVTNQYEIADEVRYSIISAVVPNEDNNTNSFFSRVKNLFIRKNSTSQPEPSMPEDALPVLSPVSEEGLQRINVTSQPSGKDLSYLPLMTESTSS